MLREREEARKIAEQIQHAVESYTNSKENEQSRSILIQSCEAYVSHIDRHILKEDTRFSVIAERRLRDQESKVGDLIDAVETANTIKDKEGRRHQQFEEKADFIFIACFVMLLSHFLQGKRSKLIHVFPGQHAMRQ